MNKEFVSYNQALALKELGFDEESFGHYRTYGKNLFYATPIARNLPARYRVINAPLYQQAFRWFRIQHGLYSAIVPKKSYPDNFVSGIEWYVEICGGDGIEIGPDGTYSYKEAESACLDKLIEICKNK